MRTTFKTRLFSVTSSTLGSILFLIGGLGGIAAAHAESSSGLVMDAHHTATYAALGDSVAAGVGLAYDPAGTAQDKACVRSTQGYPVVLEQRLQGALKLNDLACSGATTASILGPQTASGVTLPSQLDAAFQNGTPVGLTLTIGANDIHWSDLLTQCYVGTCDTSANTAAVQGYLATVKTNLASIFSSIRARSYGHPPITIITGYYNPVSSACVSPSGPLTGSEVDWITQQDVALNSVLRAAAQQSGYAIFAPVDFTGHDVCSADPWLQRPGVASEPYAFHPNVTGQQQIANDIETALLNWWE